MLPLLLMLMQVGPDVHTYKLPALPATQPRHEHVQPAAAPAPAADPLRDCITRGRNDPAGGEAYARDLIARATTPEAKIKPAQCLGLLLTDDGDYAGAQAAFADGATAAGQSPAAVPLMAMAGNAALANHDAPAALGWFDRALAVKGAVDPVAQGDIHADRARALVLLDRPDEAKAALAEARRLAPGDAQVFLLSATLARRNHDLAGAQGFIETAATLDPRDPAIGLEAGVIAELSGHEAAARKSWNSVVGAAPESPEAETARGYLAQLGPAPLDQTPAPPPSSPGPHM